MSSVKHEPISVLVVDDSQLNRELIEKTLRDEGFEVRTAASGDEAVRGVVAGALAEVATRTLARDFRTCDPKNEVRVYLLEGGERILALSDGSLTAKELIPSVPRLISPSDQRVFVYESPDEAELSLSWEAVPGIQKYRVQIADRYFARSEDTITVHSSLKEVTLFSEHNLCQDRRGDQCLLPEFHRRIRQRGCPFFRLIG